MSNNDHEGEELVRIALQELQELEMQSDSPVVGRDFREVILRQMALSHALFDRQHQDIQRQIEENRFFFERQHQDAEQLHSSVKLFNASSKRLERLTYALIGATGALVVMTYLLIPH